MSVPFNIKFVVVAVNMHDQRDILVVVVAVVCVLTCISFKRVLSHLVVVVVVAAGFHFHFDLFFWGLASLNFYCPDSVLLLLLLFLASFHFVVVSCGSCNTEAAKKFLSGIFQYVFVCDFLRPSPQNMRSSRPISPLIFVLLCLFACCFVLIRRKRCNDNNNSDCDSSAIHQCHLNTLTLRQWV